MIGSALISVICISEQMLGEHFVPTVRIHENYTLVPMTLAKQLRIRLINHRICVPVEAVLGLDASAKIP